MSEELWPGKVAPSQGVLSTLSRTISSSDFLNSDVTLKCDHSAHCSFPPISLCLLLDYPMKPVISWLNCKIQKPVVRQDILLYNIHLLKLVKEMKEAGRTFVHIFVTPRVKGHLTVIPVLEKPPSPTRAMQQNRTFSQTLDQKHAELLWQFFF